MKYSIMIMMVKITRKLKGKKWHALIIKKILSEKSPDTNKKVKKRLSITKNTKWNDFYIFHIKYLQYLHLKLELEYLCSLRYSPLAQVYTSNELAWLSALIFESFWWSNHNRTSWTYPKSTRRLELEYLKGYQRWWVRQLNEWEWLIK